uniref:pectate lyase n=1 Tax=uncultured Caulobacter sp. TaxID=158749 RepID=UPI0025ED89E3|nr:pectate lyase [uncultured Caulobacter sp.]
MFGGLALALCPGVSPVCAQAVAAKVNTDESRVGAYVLPEALKLESGAPVGDAATWAKTRRGEVLELFRVHQFGRTPTTYVPLNADTWETGVASFGRLAARTQARLIFPGHADSPTIRVVLYAPAAAKGPVPVLLHIGFSPNVLVFDDPGIEEGLGWNVREKKRVPGRQATLLAGFDPKPFLERGLAVAHVYYGDIEPDFDGGAAFGVRTLFGSQDGPRQPDAWGAIGAWSWGLSRVVDYLSGDPAIDPRKIALSGASRLGKTTLWAAAQEPRIALVMPVISGEGGAALSRRDYGETIAAITDPTRYGYWFAPRYRTYADRVKDLPVDSHMLLSLIAPRPMLLVTGDTDTWSDPRGEFLAAKAATPVYRLYGKTGVEGEQPIAETPPAGDLAFYMHKGGHALLPGDLVVMADFMARQFADARPAASDPVAAANAARKANRNMPTGWWAAAKARPDAWFAGPEARRMADNLLSWQDPASGGWPLMNTVGEPNIGDPAAVGPWGTRAALIKATVNEMRFLARVQKVRPDPAYVQAIDRGLGFILAAQYPAGGWPHSWPVFVNAYDHQATLNDDEMVDLMSLLREVAAAPDFQGLAPERRAAAQAAFDRALDFILKAQIVVDGRPTAWAQQYDEVSLAPRPARAFEPVAVSGSESASVLMLLMSLDKPSPAVKAAIRAGAAWYRSVQLNGIRVVYADGDRLVREDPAAPPLWARFYEIGTNRPIFAGRDGVIRYRLAEVEKERRGGYGWYGDWGAAVLARYAEWARTHGD